MYKILLVEDDPAIARLVAQELENWGFETKRTENFADVLGVFHTFQPNLVLLDLSLPHRSGFYWCGEIRKTSTVPILFLSSAADNMNQVTALNQGADDFVAKPFDMRLLLAKVQALLRRSYALGAPVAALSCHGVSLDADAMALRCRGGGAVPLTPNELRILQLLMAQPGRVNRREDIMRALWEDEAFIDDNTLTVNVARLRKKLDDAGLVGFIETKKGAGYFVPPER